MTVDIPKGFSARPYGESIVLRPIGQEGRRSVFEIRLTPGHGRDATALTERRPLGATLARYRMTRETEGSGGEETALVAEVQRVGGVIRLEASAQRDDGAEPDFEPTWSALATARCTEIR
nr:Tsi3 family protein [Methylorubrum extorquens]